MELIRNNCNKSYVDLLISIHPVYVKQIMAGTKKYEFRRLMFKRNVRNIFIYSTAPDKKVVGYIKYTGCLKGAVGEIWNHCNDVSGIDEASFINYFKGKEFAYAIKIDEFIQFKHPVPLDVFSPIKQLTPPQSFLYLEENVYEKFSGNMV